jgi:hypothetical protein
MAISIARGRASVIIPIAFFPIAFLIADGIVV